LEKRILAKKQVAGIWGPPGTGKTFVLANEATRAVTEVVCAYRNSTVDQTLRKIVQLLKFRYGWNDEIVRRAVKRIGSIAKVKNDILPHFSRNRNELTTVRIIDKINARLPLKGVAYQAADSA
jgi:superfamily II DNA or RNA helicase